MSFTTKYAVPCQLKDRILELIIRKRQNNLSDVFTFCQLQRKDPFCVVPVSQLGLTAVRTAGTATVVLSKSFFRSFF